jgi:hypothetical protein
MMSLNFGCSIEKVIHTLIEAFILVGLVVFLFGEAVYNNPCDCCASIVGTLFYAILDIT